jgi:hypothetical protein
MVAVGLVLGQGQQEAAAGAANVEMERQLRLTEKLGWRRQGPG